MGWRRRVGKCLLMYLRRQRDASRVEEPHGKREPDRAERERSVIPDAPLPPFGWLDTAGLKIVVQAAKQLGVPRTTGAEKQEVVAAIKKHPKRWYARRFAPYASVQ